MLDVSPQASVTTRTDLVLIRNSGIGPVLKTEFPSRKQQLNLTDENFSICFYASPNVSGSVKTIFNKYLKIFILKDFGNEFRRMEMEEEKES